MYKAIIFDFFGVIKTDQYENWLQSRGYERTGAFAHASQDADSGNISMEEFFERLGRLSNQTTQDVKAQYYTDDTINNEIIALIKTLRHHYRLALLSNSNSAYLRGILKQYALEPLFDEIIISGEIGLTKPGKEIFNYTLHKLNMNYDEVIFIDDRQENIIAAERLGIRSLLFTHADKLTHDLEGLHITLS